MRKIVLSVIVLGTLTFANAQKKEESTNKKNDSSFGFSMQDYFIEGIFQFSSTSGSTEDVNTFVFSPSVGYFIRENVAIGGRLAYLSHKEEDVFGNVVNKISAFGIQAFARHYFLDLGKRFKTYADYSLGFESGKQGVPGTKYTGLGIVAGLGVNYFVTEKIALNIGLADVFSVRSISPDQGDTITQIKGNVNVFNNFFTQAQFGLTFKK